VWTEHVWPPPPPEGEPVAGRGLPSRAAWWGLAGVAAGVVLSVLLQGIAYVIDPNSEPLIVLFGEIGLWTALAGTCLLASRRYGTGRLSDDFGFRIRAKDLTTGVGGFLACFVVAGVVGSIFSHTPFHGTNTGIIRNQKGNEVGLAVVAGIAAIGAPIFEELFFRGFLRLSLQTRIGAIGAVWAQAACFGLAHFQPNQGLGSVSIIGGTMALGVVLGYLARNTGRLGAGMVAHGMFNLAVTLIIVLAPK
jgi:membrane protease YdiL (CAAX protease family)